MNNIPGAWERQVYRTSFGRPQPETLTVGAIMRILADHGMEHVAEIRAIRQAHGR